METVTNIPRFRPLRRGQTHKGCPYRKQTAWTAFKGVRSPGGQDLPARRNPCACGLSRPFQRAPSLSRDRRKSTADGLLPDMGIDIVRDHRLRLCGERRCRQVGVYLVENEHLDIRLGLLLLPETFELGEMCLYGLAQAVAEPGERVLGTPTTVTGSSNYMEQNCLFSPTRSGDSSSTR